MASSRETGSSPCLSFFRTSRVQVAQIIADEQGNVIKLEHNQFVSTNRNAAVELRITMEAFGTEHKKRILDALEKKGFRPKLISAKLY